jgi:hypothetical protein
MAASASAASRSARRRWATVIALSAGLHALVLGSLAFRVAQGPRILAINTFDVSLAPAPPFAAPLRAPPAPKTLPTQGRIVPMEPAPRYVASADAQSGDADDAVDLFGPVFADGMWPRPVVVARTPCEDEPDLERTAACRRELLLIGLASEARAGSNAAP